MRKCTLVLLLLAAVSLGAAFAQSGFWGGVSFGYPGLNLHVGAEDIFNTIDGRATLGFNYIGGGFVIAADALVGLPVDTAFPLNVYAGGGPLLVAGGGAGFGLGISVFVGGEFRLVDLNFPQGGVFLELGPTLSFLPSLGAGFLGRAGFNYHF